MTRITFRGELDHSVMTLSGWDVETAALVGRRDMRLPIVPVREKGRRGGSMVCATIKILDHLIRVMGSRRTVYVRKNSRVNSSQA